MHIYVKIIIKKVRNLRGREEGRTGKTRERSERVKVCNYILILNFKLLRYYPIVIINY